jgi:hypothetical protein
LFDLVHVLASDSLITQLNSEVVDITEKFLKVIAIEFKGHCFVSDCYAVAVDKVNEFNGFDSLIVA